MSARRRERCTTNGYCASSGSIDEARHIGELCLQRTRKSFPDVAITIEDMVTEGDRIVNRYIERGTLTGRTFLGIEPDGQRYEKPGTTIYRVADGRLAESWGVEDTLGWFRQLGKYTE